MGIPIGICASLAAVFYRYALSAADSICLYAFSEANTPIYIVLVFIALALLGFIAGKLAESEPMIKGSGIPQVKGELKGYFYMKWLPVLIKKFAGGVICALGGLSLGREGPSVQLGAMSAKGVSKVFNCSEEERKYMLVCGACAGLAAAFNAPFAGILFALEEIYKKFSPEILLSSMSSTLTADIVSKLFFGTAPSLNFELAASLPFNYYLLYIVVGIVTGLAGVGYNKTLLFTQKLYGKLKIPQWAKIIIPFMVAGVLGFVLPDALGGGHHIFEGISNNNYTVSFMVLLLFVKFAFSMVSFCCGAPGGIFFPLLVLGALCGSIFFGVSEYIFGIPHMYALNFMLLGMVGMFSSIVRAPLTGVILVVEMSGSATQLIGLAIVAAISTLVAELLKNKPIYDSLLENIKKTE